MSTPSETEEPERHVNPPLSGSVKLIAGILLAIPMIALALVPTYSSETPKLWGFPFFYWYQLLWVLLTPLFTYSAYAVIQRARRQSR
jgi:hypothetical protein